MIATKSAEPAPKTAGGTRFKTPSCGPKHPIHALHETLGNQAVQRLYKSGLLQAKLGLSNPGDRFEREADRVADQVMRLPGPLVQPKPGGPLAASPCGEEELIRRHPLAEAISRIAAGAANSSEVAPATESTIRSLSGGGQPLAASERSFFEPRFGTDFGGVRLHTGATAGNLAETVQAQAFTVGSDIVFGRRQYLPGTSEGKRLLAHELTHVVQQSGADATYAVPGNIKRCPSPINSVPTVDTQAPSLCASTGAKEVVQREVKPKQPQPSHQLVQIAQTAINELDDDQRSKVLLSTVLAAGKLSELPAFAAILKAKPHKTFGDYFIFLVNELEEGLGSKSTVVILKLFADAGVDITMLLKPSGVEALAAVAKFKSLVQRYKALLSAGKVPEADRQHVGQLIEEAEIALRRIEGPPRKPGVQVKLAGGGAVATAAGVLWRTAGVLAADDVTGIGVADDVAIPFVIIAAATLSAIALFTGGPKPVILNYDPARAKINAALVAMAVAIELAKRPPKPKPEPKPEPTKTVEPIPATPTKPEERRRRRKCRDKDPCDTPLPIKWPRILPLPTERRPIVRTPSDDWNLEPDSRSQPQRDMQSEIQDARAKNVPPPRPCFKHDAEPNAPYDAHHMHPLFIGGAEDTKNLCALRADYHQRGHPQLYRQEDMLSDAVWIACKICEGNLRNHPAGQEYYISGRK